MRAALKEPALLSRSVGNVFLTILHVSTREGPSSVVFTPVSILITSLGWITLKTMKNAYARAAFRLVSDSRVTDPTQVRQRNHNPLQKQLNLGKTS